MKHRILALALVVIAAGCGGETSDEPATTTAAPATTTTSAPTTTTTTTAAPATTTTTEAPAPAELVVDVVGDVDLTPVTASWYAAYGSSFFYAEFEVGGDTEWEVFEMTATVYDAVGKDLGTTSVTSLPYVLKPGGTMLFDGTYFDGEVEAARVELAITNPNPYMASDFYRAADGLVIDGLEVFKDSGNWYVSGTMTNTSSITELNSIQIAVYDEAGDIVGMALVDESTAPGLDSMESGDAVSFTVDVYPQGIPVSAKAVADGAYSSYSTE